LDGRDTVYIAWAVGEDPSADIHVASSDDQGRSFGEPHVRVGGTGRADAPRLVVDREGRVHLVYAESPSGPAGSARIHYTHSPPGALRFEAPRAVGDGRFPQLALDGQGGLYVAWERVAGPGERPRGLGFSYSPDRGGAFSSPSVVPETDAPQRGFNSGLQGLFMKKLAVSPTGAVALAHSTHQPEETSRVWLLRGQAPREGRPPPAARRPHPRD